MKVVKHNCRDINNFFSANVQVERFGFLDLNTYCWYWPTGYEKLILDTTCISGKVIVEIEQYSNF